MNARLVIRLVTVLSVDVLFFDHVPKEQMREHLDDHLSEKKVPEAAFLSRVG